MSRRRLFSVDTHVDEPEEDLVARLPAELQRVAPRFIEIDGQVLRLVPGLGTLSEDVSNRFAGELATTDERRREFRDDPMGGRDLHRRDREQASDGVRAEVVFPNRYLALQAHPSGDYQAAMARAYNSFVLDLFGSDPQRWLPAAILPLGSMEDCLAELSAVADSGFKVVMLPPTVPWRPYFLPDYDRLWAELAALQVIPAFHVFAGNLAYGADFANSFALDEALMEGGRAAVARLGYDRVGQQHTFLGLAHTVMGMAAGMSPLLQLTASGVLDRNPDLRFLIVEAEAGWLPFVLDAMDHNQDRRPEVRKLDLRASDYFRRQGFISFSTDRTTVKLRHEIGVDRLVWGNDYPHDEGSYPSSHATLESLMNGVPPKEADAMLWGNAARLFGMELTP